MTATKDRKKKKQVESLKHKDKRKNIPTEELRDFVAEDEERPPVAPRPWRRRRAAWRLSDNSYRPLLTARTMVSAHSAWHCGWKRIVSTQ